jgi:replicative DNA helicase
MSNEIRRKKITPKEIISKAIGNEMGRIAPNARDLEMAVLGAIMLDREAESKVSEILQSSSFYDPRHAVVFSAIHALVGKGEPIDILTVTQELRATGMLESAGGQAYLVKLTNNVASAANIEAHARIISQKFIQRAMINIANHVIERAYSEDGDVLTMLDEAEASFFSVAQGNIRKNYDKMSEVVKAAFTALDNAMLNKSGVNGVPSGFAGIDRVTNGWQSSDLIILAARPAMGKTAFVLSMARNMAVDFGVPVAVFSLEMSSLQLVQRLISSESEIENDKLRRGNIQQYELEQIHLRCAKLANAPIFIDDTPALSVFELRAKARRLKSNHGIQCIIIDYLQLMTVGGDSKTGNREQEISTISRSLKQIAKELDMPVIALSQLSRAVETRGADKRPQLSDLRESGAIEQDADIVAFLYRPEYYGLETSNDGTPTAGLGMLLIAKHRNGSLADVKMHFRKELAKFSDWEESYGSYGGGFNSDSMGRSSISANTSFEQQAPTTITMSSKLNSMEDDDEPFNYSSGGFDEPPF